MAAQPVKNPEYIDFLLSTGIQRQLGFQVNVGTPDSKKERIGCLRWMLIARSKVLRTMLLESELKEGNEITIDDLKPNTFIDFLKYVYGHDHTSGLQFGESIDLLAAAEKYDVAELKSRLAGLTTAQVTPENVCTVLENGPVCETVPELWEKTTEIIQTKTDVVFSLPQFLTLSPSAVVHILQQDTLNVVEIDVWRASLNWAWSQLSCDTENASPEVMRNTMDPLLRHTRLCTVPLLEISKEVVPSNILNKDELVEIYMSISTQEESTKLGDVCSSMNVRELKCKKNVAYETYTPEAAYYICNSLKSTNFEMLVKKANLELVSAHIWSNKAPWTGPLPQGLTYQCEGKITIHKINYSNNASYDLLHEIPFSKTVEYSRQVYLKLQSSNGENVILDANNKYKIAIEFNVAHRTVEHNTSSPEWIKHGFSLSNFTLLDNNPHPTGKYGHHFDSLNYRVQS